MTQRLGDFTFWLSPWLCLTPSNTGIYQLVTLCHWRQKWMHIWLCHRYSQFCHLRKTDHVEVNFIVGV